MTSTSHQASSPGDNQCHRQQGWSTMRGCTAILVVALVATSCHGPAKAPARTPAVPSGYELSPVTSEDSAAFSREYGAALGAGTVETWAVTAPPQRPAPLLRLVVAHSRAKIGRIRVMKRL